MTRQGVAALAVIATVCCALTLFSPPSAVAAAKANDGSKASATKSAQKPKVVSHAGKKSQADQDSKGGSQKQKVRPAVRDILEKSPAYGSGHK